MAGSDCDTYLAWLALSRQRPGCKWLNEESSRIRGNNIGKCWLCSVFPKMRHRKGTPGTEGNLY